MKYKKIDAMNYQYYMNQYHIGSLLAKIIDFYQWDEKQIACFLSKPRSYDSKQHEVAIKIKDRILQAKQHHEKVFVFGDYDTDGICATAMLIKLLRSLHIETGYYIPNRLQEGYGLNTLRTNQAIEKGYQLIITVDNGVKAYEALEMAKQKAIDVIVMDHHTLEKEVPCYALWHPQIIDDSCRCLCGAGCVLQIVKLFDVDVEEYLPMAAVATIGDMVELVGENRWIVKQGLQMIREGKNLAICALLNQTTQVCEEDIAYVVVPKLNAVGRLADRANVNQVVSFLLCDDIVEIDRFAKQIQAINDERKQMTLAHEQLVQKKDTEKDFIIVKHSKFHPGIVGLLANKLCRMYNKPVMVLSEKDDFYVGSIRSIASLNIMDCLQGIAEYMEAFGGHKLAAGITFKKEYLESISSYLQTYPYEQVEETAFCIAINDSDLQRSNIQEVFDYGPYGQGVELPRIWYEKPFIQNYRFMKKETYLKWQLPTVEAIWFSQTNTYTDYVDVKDLIFIGKLGIHLYRGVKNYTLQLEQVIK